jgi:filamentous hemagglutinin family protein
MSHAQVKSTLTPDGTLGTTVTQSGTVHTITGGTRPGNGPNLFHSFDRFSVGTGETASFTSEQTGIKHIVSRVTGGLRSDIDGQLRTDGQLRSEGADLYLLNPAGVLFGSNARLDVSGSFHVSTADYLRFADGAKLHADLGQGSRLTVAEPAAFGFLGSTPAPITMQGSGLGVPTGRALSVVGGDITLAGGMLQAASGRIQLASVASPGEVVLSPLELAPELRVEGVARLGQIALSQGVNVTVSSPGGGAVSSRPGAGTVLIRGGRLLVDNAFVNANTTGAGDGARLGIDMRLAEDLVLRNNGQLRADSGGAGRAGDLWLTAGRLDSDGDASLIGSRPFASGDGGAVTLHVGNLSLTGGAQIDTGTRGSGHGGTLTVVAQDTLTLAGASSQGTPSGLFASAERGSSGSAGALQVEAGTLTLTGGAQISSSTFGPGQGGTVTVVARDTLTLAGTSPDGRFSSGLFANAEQGSSGSAGALRVEAGTLTLTGGARISSTTFGPGQGGMVRVTATDTLTLAGTSADGTPSGIFASALGTGAGAGNAGSIVVEAPRVTLTDGARLSSTTSGPGQGGMVRVTATDTLTLAGTSADGISSGITASTAGQETGTGNAGSIVVEAPRVTLTDGAQIASTTSGPGHGGTVQVTATKSLLLAGISPDGTTSSGIFASAEGTGAGAGNAGSIVVQAPRIALTGGAQIFSGTFGPGQGGTVQVTATDTLTLAGLSSGIFANTQPDVGVGAGNGGNIIVQAPRIALTAGAQINSETLGSGQGGTVQVTATDTLTLAGTSPDGKITSGISASTEGTEAGAGNAGSIVVQAPRIALTGGGQINSGTMGPGQGGTVQVTASETLSLVGTTPDGKSHSGISASTHGTEAGAGDAGAVVVEARTVRIADGAQITSNTLGPGHGGTVTVTTAEAFTLVGPTSGLRTTAAGSGPGGDITVQARQIQLTDGAVIAAESTGTGNAGNLTLAASDTLLLRGHSAVTTAASQAKGGNIQVTAPAMVRLQDSQLTATVGGGAGDGGNVTLDPAFIVLQGSQITANAFAGRGGRISLTASQAFLADPNSTVTASSTLGINGEVNIQAPVTNISGAVAPLSQAFAQSAELVRSRCAERLREGTVSRFVVGGRDGVPLEPGSLLPSPLVREEQPGPAPLAEPVAGQREAFFGPGGGLERHNPGSLSLRGAHAQARWSGALDVECAKWRGQ